MNGASLDEKRPVHPPGPGPWRLDASHFDRPFTEVMKEIFIPGWVEGQRATVVESGLLIDELAWGLVDDFFYYQLRPFGASPRRPAPRPPPRLVFAALTALHPGMRARLRTARRVWETRAWRASLARWRHVVVPGIRRELAALGADDVRSLDDERLARHVHDVMDLARRAMIEHFRFTGATVIPVGAFIAHATSATGATMPEVIRVLGRSGLGALEAARRAAARRALEEAGLSPLLDDEDPARALAVLQSARGEGLAPLHAWLDESAMRQVQAGDLDNPIGAEVPHLLVAALRGDDARPSAPDDARTLLERVPARDRALLDELLVDARACLGIRDERCALVDAWTLGLVRRALLEAGRRLVARAQLARTDHVLECPTRETIAALRGASVVDGERAASRARHRATRSIDDMPLSLGGVDPGPPPLAWLGRGAREVHEAVITYVRLMNDDAACDDVDACARGFAASPGRHIGIARHVVDSSDAARVRRGDVLIARATMPAYNAMFLVAGGVATDRGGVLCHAAIVARELGIPSVVGCRDVTKRIPDGARVVIDGDRGVVECLA